MFNLKGKVAIITGATMWLGRDMAEINRKTWHLKYTGSIARAMSNIIEISKEEI